MGTLVVSKSTSRSLTFEANDSMNVSQVFENWMEEHERTYSSSEEKAKRFAIFKKGIERIESFNSLGNHSFKLGVNAFTDMTHEEFQETYGCTFDIPERDFSTISTFRYQSFNADDLPESWDWREQGAVTNVKRQGDGGACWAFATAATVEGLTPFYNKPYGKLMNLSVQQFIACSKAYGSNGCKKGRAMSGMMYVRDNGLVTEESFPYRGADDQSCANQTGYLHDPAIRIYGFEVVPEFDEVALKKAIYHQPVLVMHSTSQGFKDYTTGIFLDADGECAKGEISHSSVIVGYGTTPFGEDYWILKNSWGTNWGEDGYMRINRNSKNRRGTCNLAKTPVYGFL